MSDKIQFSYCKLFVIIKIVLYIKYNCILQTKIFKYYLKWLKLKAFNIKGIINITFLLIMDFWEMQKNKNFRNYKIVNLRKKLRFVGVWVDRIYKKSLVFLLLEIKHTSIRYLLFESLSWLSMIINCFCSNLL